VPELPEVETIKRELEKVVIGKKISKVSVYNPKVIRSPSVSKFQTTLSGTRINRILRRGKALIFELSNAKALVVHLKMTGQLIYPGSKSKERKVSFDFSGGDSLAFNDQRLFAEIRLMDDWRELKFIQGLGPEPKDLTLSKFQDMLAGKKTKIKPLLMDQKFISGIGNLYAAEILFAAKINPMQRANNLSNKDKERIYNAMRSVLDAAIKHGGSSIDNYLRLSGARGEYKKYHKVYGREGKPCFICKSLIKRSVLGGRGTYFCPKCQR
jgi:formamidopyrimidine-DNA glycosylase